MVPAFGFSVGDFIAGTKVVIDIFCAFKETGGASARYTREAEFLKGLISTLEQLQNLIDNSPAEDDLIKDLSKLLKAVNGPLDEFREFLAKYEEALGKASSTKTFKKATKVIKYTLKDMSGKVERLRVQIEQPLQAINMLLSIYAIKSVRNSTEKLLSPAQCAQIVEAIKLADIPAELNKQIHTLQKSANDHGIQHDEQLRNIQELRDNIDDEFASLDAQLHAAEQASVVTIEAHASSEESLHRQSIVRLTSVLQTRDDKMQSMLEEQTVLLLALRTYMEEKAAMQEPVLPLEQTSSSTGAQKEITTPWPSATLAAAHLAVGFLSAVVAGAATFSITRRTQAVQPKQELVYQSRVPIVTYVHEPPFHTNNRVGGLSPRTSSNTTAARPIEESDAPAWIGEFSDTAGEYQERDVRKNDAQRDDASVSPPNGRSSTVVGWSSKLSKLDTEAPTGGHIEHDEDPFRRHTFMGRGIVIVEQGKAGHEEQADHTAVEDDNISAVNGSETSSMFSLEAGCLGSDCSDGGNGHGGSDGGWNCFDGGGGDDGDDWDGGDDGGDDGED